MGDSPLENNNIGDFIQSIVQIENAFANVLNSQSDYLDAHRDNFTPEQLLQYNDHLAEIIKLAIKKEIILEFLLDEIKKCPKPCPPKRPKPDKPCKGKKCKPKKCKHKRKWKCRCKKSCHHHQCHYKSGCSCCE